MKYLNKFLLLAVTFISACSGPAMRNAHTLGKGETLVCGGLAVAGIGPVSPVPVVVIAHGMNDELELDVRLDGMAAKAGFRYQLKDGQQDSWSAVGFTRVGAPITFPLPQAELGLTAGFPFSWGELNWTTTAGLTLIPDLDTRGESYVFHVGHKKSAVALLPTAYTGLGLELPTRWEGIHWVLEGGCSFPLPLGPELAVGLRRAF